jgi:two-component system, chemotaxis family, chemotaxis protein CheY
MPDAKTILTVDDSATMREMLLSTLSALGYRVVQAADGVAALETLQQERPDVIITDMNMPRLDGLGLIEQIRHDNARRATPILVLTTESDSVLKERARRAGATGWIVKPFDPAKLADVLRRVTA